MSVLSVEDRKGELLAHYARRKPYQYLQLDGFTGIPVEDVMCGDDDGYAVCMTQTWELRTGNIPVRVHVLAGTSKADTVALLRRILNWVEKEGEVLLLPKLEPEPKQDIPF